MEILLLFLADPIGFFAGFGIGYIISMVRKLKGF